MDWKTVNEQIGALEKEYIALWERVCNIESPTDCKAGVDAVGICFTDLARQRGWNVEILEEKVSGNAVCITMNPDAPGRPVALSAHLDTVHPIGLFGNPPVRIEGDKIYGPGVEDCKGGAVAAFLAMDSLSRCGYADRPVLLLLQSDEEISSITSEKRTIDFMAEKAKNCVAFLNAEGHNGKLVGVRKGILRYVFEVTGVAAHSSRCQTGVNAIAEAAHKILELEKWKDPEGLTCNCGVIEGGSAANSVPASCTFVADIRYATDEQMRRAEEFVKEVAARAYLPGSSCTVTEKSRRVAMEDCPRNREIFSKIERIYAEIGLPAVEWGSSTGGSDAAWMTVAGIPCLDNFGVHGGKIHSKDEYAYLDSLAASARMMAAVILKIDL